MPNTKDQKGSAEVASGAEARIVTAAAPQSSQFKLSLISSPFGPEAAANNTLGKQSTSFLVARPAWSTPSKPPCLKR